MKQTWEQAQAWEKKWHDSQQFNTYNEETKQYIYAGFLGLHVYAVNNYNQRGWDFGDQTVLDVGGGEVSMLLKSTAKKRVVVDPLDYAKWIKLRYREAGIEFKNVRAEDMEFDEVFDECLLYNCLQHTDDPEFIVRKIRKYAKTIRVFEWVDEGISDGHIHNLTEQSLNKWLGGFGRVVNIQNYPCVGKAYYGIFKGDDYGK